MNVKFKQLLYLLFFFSFCISQSAEAQIKVKSNGYVGINNTNPSFNLHVLGTAKFNEVRIFNNSMRLQRGSWNALRIRTGTGYGDVGSMNAGWFHFLSDRPAYFFNKHVSPFGNLYPYRQNVQYLGYYSNRWWRAYMTTVYSLVNLSLSDSRAKENIQPIENALDIVMQLEGKSYDYKKEVFTPSSPKLPYDTVEAGEDEAVKSASTQIDGNEAQYDKISAEGEILRKNKMGFLAQDVEKVLPGAVFYDKEQDSYSLNYQEMIPLLVEALKEQQKQIEILKAKIDQ